MFPFIVGLGVGWMLFDSSGQKFVGVVGKVVHSQVSKATKEVQDLVAELKEKGVKPTEKKRADTPETTGVKTPTQDPEEPITTTPEAENGDRP